MSRHTNLQVELANAGNPDHNEDPSRPLPGTPGPVWVKAESLSDASSRCREYIEDHHLGGGNWSGGRIRDDKNNVFAYVSYNGKVWAGRREDWRPDAKPLYNPIFSAQPRP